MRRRRTVSIALFSLLLAATASEEAQATTSYQLTTFDHPDAIVTVCTGINDSGQVVGFFVDSSGPQGFVWSGGVFVTTFKYPDPNTVFLNTGKINNQGDIVGSVTLNNSTAPQQGFLLSSGMFTPVDPGLSGEQSVTAEGINDAGDIVGSATTNGGGDGFLLRGSTVTSIDVPSVGATSLRDINTAGEMAATWFTPAPGGSDLVTLSGNILTFTPVPAPIVHIEGLNDAGQVVGLDKNGDGVVVSNGIATSLAGFHPRDINIHGVIAGFGPSGCVVATPGVPFSHIFVVEGPIRVPPGVPVMKLRFRIELAPDSNGIDPLTEPVSIGLGGVVLTVPPGSFRSGRDGTFQFRGPLGDIEIRVVITPGAGAPRAAAVGGPPDAGREIEVVVEMVGAPQFSPAVPLPVTLSIGDDTGTIDLALRERAAP